MSATGNPRNKVVLKPGHSLMDWVRLGNSGIDLTGVGGVPQQVTSQQLAAHNKKTDAWIAIRGKVFNVTRYMDFHPGGEDELMRGAGQDATDLFNQVHAWVNYESLLQKCFVGRLVHVEKGPATSKASSFFEKLFPKKTCQDKALRMDWYQTSSAVCLQFFTKELYSQARVVLHDSLRDLSVCIRLEKTVHMTHVMLECAVSWPCKVKKNHRTGNVEVVFNKVQAGMWTKLGEIREETQEPNQLLYDSMEVASIAEVTHNTSLITLRHKQHIYDTFPLGCYVNVRLNINGEEVVRSYTPVVTSLDADFPGDQLHLMVKQYSQGVMSRHICSLKPQDSLSVSRPVGSLHFSLFSSYNYMILIAAGTGFTPMIQLIVWILNSGNKQKLNKVNLLFFNIAEQDILWRDQLDKLIAADARFTVTHVLSRPNNNWTGPTGHLTIELLQNAVPSDKKCDSFLFVCGPPPFNQLASKILKELDFSENQYHIFQG